MDVESKGADRHSGRLSTLHKTGPPVRDDATPVYPAERKEKVLARDRRVKLKLRAATNGRTGMRLEFEFRKNSCFLNGTGNHHIDDGKGMHDRWRKDGGWHAGATLRRIKVGTIKSHEGRKGGIIGHWTCKRSSCRIQTRRQKEVSPEYPLPVVQI